MSVVFLNMKFIMTDIQFAPLNSILLFILNILLTNILPVEYSNEYPAGWYLVEKFRTTLISDADSICGI